MAEVEQLGGVTKGAVGVAPGHGLYESRSTPVTVIGSKLELNDGRQFRMAEFAGDTAAANVCAPDVSATGSAEVDNEFSATYAAGSVGPLEFDDAASAANKFKDAYLMTTDDAGEGYMYKIKSNTASDGTHITITLYDPLVVAVTTATDVAIVGHPWAKLIKANAAVDGCVSGCCILAIDYSEAAYGWVQTKGVGICLADGVIAIEDMLVLSDGVDGAVQTMDAYTEHYLGNALFAPDDTGHVGVWWHIE